MSRQRIGIQDRSFQSEFAGFVAFVGPDAINNATRRVRAKLTTRSEPAREVYGERFFFHQQLDQFIERDFQLDVNDFMAVRAACLIASTNLVRKQLSEQGAKHLRSMIIDNLKPDRDVRQIEHELRSYIHISQLDLDVDFSDLEGAQLEKRFDLIVRGSAGEYEVECKTVHLDAGSQIKQELKANLTSVFETRILRRTLESQSGLFVLTLLRPTSECKRLPEKFSEALEADILPFECEDFSLTFEERPKWESSGRPEEIQLLQEAIKAEAGGDLVFGMRRGNRWVAIVFRPHAPGRLGERIVQVIHEASQQCSGIRPCVIWLHLIGYPQSAFTDPEFAGHLDEIARKGILTDAPPGFRRHIERVRFTADASQLTGRQVVGADGRLQHSVSVDGMTYDVANPHCMFSPIQQV